MTSYGPLDELRFSWWRVTRRCGAELSFERVSHSYRAVVELGNGFQLRSACDPNMVFFTFESSRCWVAYYIETNEFISIDGAVGPNVSLLYESRKDFAKLCALLFPEMVSRYASLSLRTTKLYWKHFRSYLCFFWIFRFRLPKDVRRYIWLMVSDQSRPKIR